MASEQRDLTDDPVVLISAIEHFAYCARQCALIHAWEKHKATELRHPVLRRGVGRWVLPHVQSTLLARHLRGDLRAYPPFVLP